MLQRKDGWKLAVLGIFLAAFASGFALLAKAPPAQQKNYVGGDTCLACHDIEEAFAKNPHYKSWKDESLPWDKRGCETCHGPGEAHVDGGGDVAQIFRFTEASPQDISETCLDCHLKQNETMVNFLRNEHGLNTVACTECHTVHTPQKMEGLLKARTPALCYDCHNEVRSQFNRPFRHKVNEGLMDCADCHNQHGGYSARQLRTSTGNDLPCYKCHADKQGPFVFEHAAVRVEGCAICHDPHGSSNPRLLKRSEVRFLCLECHSATLGVLSPNAPGFHNLTQPGWQNCTTCHVEIHGSNLSEVFFE